MAFVYALTAKHNAVQATTYGDAAAEVLPKATAAGWQDASHMRQDTDLDALRDRDDVKRQLKDLEKGSSDQ